MVNRPIYTVLSIFLFSCAILAQDMVFQRVDKSVISEMTRQKIPGVSVAVVKDGKLIFAKGYGLSNLEHNVPVKPESVFQSGSIGKQFTAAAVMILAERGKIDIDAPVGKYLSPVPDTWKSITVRHLLTHTSGLGDYPESFNYRKDFTEDEIFEVIKNSPLNFQPGDDWDYSNLGYVTLGILIRKVSGKFYGDFLKENIFEPLGMSTARVISEADIIPNRVSGYQLVNGEVKNHDWVSPSVNSTADGALYLTALDLAKWESGLRSGKILTDKSLEKIWTPVTLNNGKTVKYGFGWQIERTPAHNIIYHGGAWQGFKSFIARYEKDATTIVVLANLAQANPVRLTRAVAENFFPEFAEIPATISETDGETRRLIINGLLQISRRIEKSDLFAEGFLKKDIEPLRRIINDFGLPIAVIHEMDLIERRTDNGIKTSTYLLTDLARTAVLAVKTNQENKITEIRIVKTGN